jgi:hypothetical protein
MVATPFGELPVNEEITADRLQEIGLSLMAEDLRSGRIQAVRLLERDGGGYEFRVEMPVLAGEDAPGG